MSLCDIVLRVYVILPVRSCDGGAHRGKGWTSLPSLVWPVPIEDDVSETEAGLHDQATWMPAPVFGLAFVRLLQYTRDLRVDTWYRKTVGLAGCVPDCQLAG